MRRRSRSKTGLGESGAHQMLKEMQKGRIYTFYKGLQNVSDSSATALAMAIVSGKDVLDL